MKSDTEISFDFQVRRLQASSFKVARCLQISSPTIRDTLICLRPRKLVKKKVNCLIKESVTNGEGETGGDSSKPETKSRFVRHQTEDVLKRCERDVLMEF